MAGITPDARERPKETAEMCKPHWRAYTNALRKAAVERKAAETETSAGVATEPVPIEASEPTRTWAKRGSKAVVPEGGSQGDAG